ncbi:hypothetical protein HH212_26335 [Massilia forsythiae]|uniref:Uncharacterized protein n=1 Tax=Massilia forsythiae TaxID=2728020 RepID=A0A7Z2W0V1_9BURK|nr:hypothetical protein [Massilia forsythiae]QJE03076.1 hypothetical protein HH212_26335 [Massilia forsythiae]
MRDYSPLRERATKSETVLMKSATINELLDELDALRAAAAPAKMKRNDYPPAFDEVWQAYPTRPGDSKRAAHKAWATRIKNGATADEMLAGTRAYAAYVEATRVEPRFILQAATFFGPTERYACDWTVPEQQSKPAAGGSWWLSEMTMEAKGLEVGVRSIPGEQRATFEARIRAAIDNGGKPPVPPRLAQIVVPPPAAPAPEQPPETPRRAGRPEGLQQMLRDLGRAA